MYDYKFLFKILVLGDSGVGKSCLLMRFSEGRFTGQHLTTVGIDFKVCTVEVGGHVVKLQIWDTAGEERFRAVLPSYYRGAHGILLVYDTTSATSFSNVDGWLAEIGRHCRRRVNVLMVGNKCDELVDRQVSQEQATAFANLRGIAFREASAKSGANVGDIFLTLAVNIFESLVMGPSTTERLQGGGELKDEDSDEEEEQQQDGQWGRRRRPNGLRLDGSARLRATQIESCC
ncbi:hypothetical protein KR009_002647 [Drosophila setifemur]|nr:hypothetical protein KR009_002647 [Drosophila setifemur]